MVRGKSFVVRWTGVVIAVAAGVLSCDASQSEEFANVRDLHGKRIGMVAGTLFDTVVQEKIEKPQIYYFTEMPDMTAALKNGEIDCIVDDEPVLRHVAAREEGFRLLPGTLSDDRYAFAVGRGERTLATKINAKLQEMRNTGILDAIVEQWMEGKSPPANTPQASLHPDSAVLTLGVYTESPPFVFRDAAGDIVGIDIDILREVCRRLQYQLNIQAMDFDLLFEAVQDHEIDVIASCISVTEERKKILAFTDAYYDGGVGVMVLGE